MEVYRCMWQQNVLQSHTSFQTKRNVSNICPFVAQRTQTSPLSKLHSVSLLLLSYTSKIHRRFYGFSFLIHTQSLYGSFAFLGAILQKTQLATLNTEGHYSQWGHWGRKSSVVLDKPLFGNHQTKEHLFKPGFVQEKRIVLLGVVCVLSNTIKPMNNIANSLTTPSSDVLMFRCSSKQTGPNWWPHSRKYLGEKRWHLSKRVQVNLLLEDT